MFFSALTEHWVAPLMRVRKQSYWSLAWIVDCVRSVVHLGMICFWIYQLTRYYTQKVKDAVVEKQTHGWRFFITDRNWIYDTSGRDSWTIFRIIVIARSLHHITQHRIHGCMWRHNHRVVRRERQKSYRDSLVNCHKGTLLGLYVLACFSIMDHNIFIDPTSYIPYIIIQLTHLQVVTLRDLCYLSFIQPCAV